MCKAAFPTSTLQDFILCVLMQVQQLELADVTWCPRGSRGLVWHLVLSQHLFRQVGWGWRLDRLSAAAEKHPHHWRYLIVRKVLLHTVTPAYLIKMVPCSALLTSAAKSLWFFFSSVIIHFFSFKHLGHLQTSRLISVQNILFYFLSSFLFFNIWIYILPVTFISIL